MARMLANAMDPNRSNAVRQNIIETVRTFDPIDAQLMNVAYDNHVARYGNDDDCIGQQVEVHELLEKLATNISEFELSIAKLHDLKYIVTIGRSAEVTGTTSAIAIAHLGFEIMRACSP